MGSWNGTGHVIVDDNAKPRRTYSLWLPLRHCLDMIANVYGIADMKRRPRSHQRLTPGRSTHPSKSRRSNKIESSLDKHCIPSYWIQDLEIVSNSTVTRVYDYDLFKTSMNIALWVNYCFKRKFTQNGYRFKYIRTVL